MKKKTSKKSQYYRENFNGSVELQSQLGSLGYDLAKLGSEEEFYDRLRKYDREYFNLLPDCLEIVHNHYFDNIKTCYLIDKLDAFRLLNKDAAVGFGGSLEGIRDRRDPRLFQYLEDYLDVPTQCIINASQKDEVRVVGKTPRLFMSYPVEHVFMSTMVLHDFSEQFYENSYLKKGIASSVTDSPQNGAMALYKKDLMERRYLYATDTSAQDSSINPEFINFVYAWIKDKMVLDHVSNVWFERIRHNSVNKLVSMNGACYMVRGGLGSGDYLTLIINIMWRLYMVLDNYSFDLKKFFEENTVIINGDDLVMSSDHLLDLNSRHAKIEWKGMPIDISELDFCSMKFHPYIRHDYEKCLAVLNCRKKKRFVGLSSMEMQRLGGMLRLCVNPEFHAIILKRMNQLRKDYPETEQSFWSLVIDWDSVYYSYNLEYPQKRSSFELSALF